MQNKLATWVPISEDTDFSIYNLPFGIYSTDGTPQKVGVAIGDYIVDLEAMANAGLLCIDATTLVQTSLNRFIGLGKEITNRVRNEVQSFLCDVNAIAKGYDKMVIPQNKARLHLPVKIGDYTDFYSSIEHATNVGKMFRDPANALLPNWRHLPVAYHGRASSIIPSGQQVVRPKGQVLPKGSSQPVFQASKRLDFELEMAFIIGKSTSLGDTVTTENAEDYIFGLVLFNDWSARDLQQWEYVPLGPFSGKNFASSMSPWVVTLEALELFKVGASIPQEPPVLSYLQFTGNRNYDISLTVSITPLGSEETVVCRTNFRSMYWNMAQQLAHHTVNGCNINIGDVMASGTISGSTPDAFGSMLELAWAGTKPILLAGGESRIFIEDYDTVCMRGFGVKDGIRVGLGEVRNQVLPPK